MADLVVAPGPSSFWRGPAIFFLVFLGLLVGFDSKAGVLINELMYHPSSEDIREEYVELYNSGTTNLNLAGWRFSQGVQFTFPDVALPAGGFLVVAADVAVFTNKYPDVTNVIGNWEGRLSNSRETVELRDGNGDRVNSVSYADEGDWAVRQIGPLDHNHRGWIWRAAHDGEGSSLELINPDLANRHGQNWAASLVTNGTPGSVNSSLQTNIAPFILEMQHLPPVPRSTDIVLVTARLLDERGSNVTATLNWRLDRGDTNFTSVPLADDGLHDDGAAGDGVFAATIPAQTNNAVVVFYIEAMDAQGLIRTWPGPALDRDGSSLGQVVNALYQVDDSSYASGFPLYKLIMTDAERAELATIGTSAGDRDSDAQMNGTFISLDGTGTDVRYTTGFRNRGHGTRNAKPNNYRVNFTSDRPWKGVVALNLNGQYTHAQIIGAVLGLKAGLAGADSRPVQVRVNNANLGNNGPQTYGTMYAANEAIGGDWADHWFPDDGAGNVYRALRDIPPPDFEYRGTNYQSYTNTWLKESNTSENDWRDLVSMLRIVGTNDLFTTEAVRTVVNVEQWMTYLAVMALFDNRETSLNRGYNDDYFMYAGIRDPRFMLMYYDLDTILGEGNSAGSPTASIFGATADNGAGETFGRFMRWPDFEPTYYRTLQRLLETAFSEAEFNTTVDQTLAEFVPANVITRIKTWMDGRRAHVASVIAPYLATNGIPPVVTIAGEPRSPTPLRSATLTVGGAGVTHYRYRLNNGAFGQTNQVTDPIVLTDLPHGSTNAVFVIAAGTNGIWSAEADATVSRTWVVNTSWPTVRLNEVLARNVAAFNHAGTFPDAIELFNEGDSPVNLAGLRLSDRLASPNKFTFPSGTTLLPGHHLVVLANNNDGTPGFHTGFSLDQDGEGVFLFDKTGSGGALLDAVQFGLQLPDLSIGRQDGVGEFVLTQPTFGTNNVAQPLGDPHRLRINEWLASEFVTSPTDFVELYNAEPLPVALGGLYFTDNPIGAPTRHSLAPLSFLEAQGFRSFKADGDPNQGNDHLDFKLAAEQGLIALLGPDLALIDVVLYGPQRTDISQGRNPDGAMAFTFFTTPTPGSSNPSGPLPCTVTSTRLLLMDWTNVWKYNQTENLDGANWTAPEFDDSAWASGPGLLAFENDAWAEGLIGTVLDDPRVPPPGLSTGHAYYFRAALVVTNDLTGYTLNARMRLDDCAVIYINGGEFSRPRLPEGVITNRSFGGSAVGSSSDATVDEFFTIPPAWLPLGTNVIAVEVHQVNSSSSDVVWGLALEATRAFTNCLQAGLVLNEILADNASYPNAAGRTPDWIELLNAGTNTVVLDDMSLSDDVGTPRKWVFPPGISLAPGQRLVIECDDSLSPSATNTGFGLGANGDSVYLYRSPAEGGRMLDSLTFGLQAEDFSVGRIPDGAGTWTLALPTRRTANVPAGLGNASALRLNEWMASATGGDDWLELHNPNPQPVDLGSLALSDNPSVRNKSPLAPFSYLGPGGHQKFIADGRSGQVPDHLNFRLDAAGGFLGLYWPIGTQIDALSYGPQTTDVSQGRFPDGAGAFASFSETASPGAPNYLLLTDVVINELLSHTDPPLEDAVEIHNPGTNTLDLSGWYLSNSGRELRKFLVPSNTVIAAGGFKVFYEYEFGTNTSPDVLAAFSFNSAHGDEVHLSQTDAAGELTGYRARAKFGAATNSVSFGRFLTSAGEEFVAMSARSFGVDNPANIVHFRSGAGAPNPYPLVGPVVLSELHFAPTNSFDTNRPNSGEYIELFNFTAQAVPLYDPAATTNRWQISGGIEFTFPPGVTLPARGTLLVVGFDPATEVAELDWFRTAYQVSTNVPIFGPYGGAMANEGEDLQLLRPDPPQRPPSPDAGFVPYVLVEHVHYLPGAPWPTNGLGTGATLQRRVPSLFGNEPLNWFATAPTPNFDSTADTDADGLPDYWEIAHGLNPASSVGVDGPDGDPDADGQSNGQELIAGTNPHDGSDALRIEAVGAGNGEVTLRFQAAAGRSYSVLYSDDSATGPWQKLTDVPPRANARGVTLSDPQPGAVNGRFYRLTTPALPEP